MKTCLDCPHWALAFVAGGEPHGVCDVAPGAPEAGPSVPISDCPVLRLMERIEELELQRHPFAPTPAEPNIVTDPNCPEGVILAIQPRKEGETLEDLAKRSCMIKLGEKKP